MQAVAHPVLTTWKSFDFPKLYLIRSPYTKPPSIRHTNHAWKKKIYRTQTTRIKFTFTNMKNSLWLGRFSGYYPDPFALLSQNWTKVPKATSCSRDWINSATKLYILQQEHEVNNWTFSAPRQPQPSGRIQLITKFNTTTTTNNEILHSFQLNATNPFRLSPGLNGDTLKRGEKLKKRNSKHHIT